MVMVDERFVELWRNKEEGEKGRWIGIHLQPLILLNSFILYLNDYDWLKLINVYYLKFYIILALRPSYVRSVLFVS